MAMTEQTCGCNRLTSVFCGRADGAGDILRRHIFIDDRHHFRYIRFNLAREGRPREVDLGAGARAVPAGGVTTRTRAESGLTFLVIPRDARRLILNLFLRKLRG